MVGIGDIISLITAGKDLKRLYSQLKGEGYKKFVSPGEKVRSNLNLYEFLYELYYDFDFLIGPDGPFPIGLIDIKKEAIKDLNSLLGKVKKQNNEISIIHKEVINAIRSRGSEIWNGRTFSLSKAYLNDNNQIEKLDAFVGSYFDMVCSADYIEYELLASILSSKEYIALDDLYARYQVLKSDSPKNCLLNGGGVDAVIAISTLVVYKREDEYWLLCDVRSNNVAEYGDLYHVVPSFIFQPVTGVNETTIKVEWNVYHNIFREYLEELFDIPEVKRTRRPVAPDYFYGHPNLEYLNKLIGSKTAQILGTSFMFNLLTHRPEILTVLIIEDEDWYVRQKDAYKCSDWGLSCLNLNDEFLFNESQDQKIHPEIVTTLPLLSPKWTEIVKPWLMVPPAAPALILGAKLATNILGIQEPLWLKQYYVKKGRLSPFED